MATLAQTTSRAIGPSNGLRIGKIASVDGGVVLVDVGGGRQRAGVCSTYRPVAGDIVAVFRQDSTWLIVDRILPGKAVPQATSVSNSDVDNGVTNALSTASGAYVPLGAPTCGTAFVAPLSGQVMVHYECAAVDTSAAGAVAFTSFEVREGDAVGAGTVVLAADDARSFKKVGLEDVGLAAFKFVKGLTPGKAYNAQMMHRAGGGTGFYVSREIAVVPAP